VQNRGWKARKEVKSHRLQEEQRWLTTELTFRTALVGEVGALYHVSDTRPYGKNRDEIQTRGSFTPFDLQEIAIKREWQCSMQTKQSLRL